MRSFITLYGPKTLHAIDKLFEIGKEFDHLQGFPSVKSAQLVKGEFDFVYDWHLDVEKIKDKLTDHILALIKEIDIKLSDLNCKYSISTLKEYSEEIPVIESDSKVTYIKLIGPKIFSGIRLLETIKSPLFKNSGITEGITDFYFEWDLDPSKDDIYTLISMIDSAMESEQKNDSPLFLYTLTTVEETSLNDAMIEAQLQAYSRFPYW